MVGKKLNRSCEDETKTTLELTYPGICELAKEPDWKGNQTFQDMALKYTRENVLRIKLFFKEPFAVKYLIVENASR